MGFFLALLSIIFTIISLIILINKGTFKGYSKSLRKYEISQKKGESVNEIWLGIYSLFVIAFCLVYLSGSLLFYLTAFYGQYDHFQYPSLIMIAYWIVALIAGILKSKKNKREDKLGKVNLESDYEVEKYINEESKPGFKLYFSSILHIAYFVYIFIALTLL